MNHVQVNFLGRSYRLACGEGEEERLQQLAEELNDRLNLLDQRFGGDPQSLTRPPEIMLWIMTALTLLDENYDLHDELEYWHSQSSGSQDETERRLTEALQSAAQKLERLAGSE